MSNTVKLPPCKGCGEYCRQVEESDGTVWCQFCDRCRNNDHCERDCTQCITPGCTNEKKASDMCEACSLLRLKTYCIACGDKFTEKNLAVGSGLTIDPNYTTFYCGECNAKY